MQQEPQGAKNKLRPVLLALKDPQADTQVMYFIQYDMYRNATDLASEIGGQGHDVR